jgi:hypothetical protein
MSPTVITLGFHLDGKKIVITGLHEDPKKRVDVPSRLERYFGRPEGEEFDRLTYCDYFAEYLVEARRSSGSGIPDQCRPPHFANRRRKPVICMLRTVTPENTEEFALRLLLRHFPGRTFEELRTRNGTVFGTFAEAALEVGLLGDVDENARICRWDAVTLNRSPAELRFLFVLLVRQGADFGGLFEVFHECLADVGDSQAEVLEKIDRLSTSFTFPYLEYVRPRLPVGGLEDALNDLSEEQRWTAEAIVRSVIGDGSRLMFLQGAAGTGKTFRVRKIIDGLRRLGKVCVVCATTGIAAVQ